PCALLSSDPFSSIAISSTDLSTLSLHDALPILDASHSFFPMSLAPRALAILHEWVKSESLRKHCYAVADSMKHFAQLRGVFHRIDRKSTRLNSSHGSISYAVFCLKKKIETISPA